ncbi:MAG: hydantoinase B/oxoprolinase family protein [Betaproteobacteria bacterium]|nr:hydantoinase B/oxoprolinase family protein [Betaproteobacteria bacterium]
MSIATFDPVKLEVSWNRLISIATEQAAAMVNSSFSAVLGDMEDLSAGVFDARGTMMAQSVQGAPGHLGSLSAGVKSFLEVFRHADLAPGDVLITNDPWLVSGHKHDITVVTPVFLCRRLAGFAASNCHTVDIGGRIFSAEASEVYEEGLQIPRMKLFDRGRRNKTFFRILEENVRSPELVLGDLMAQVSANQTAANRLLAFMSTQKLDDLGALSAAITSRTARLMENAIARLPNGTYRDRATLDGYDLPLEICVTVTVKNSNITVDFAGTSAQVPKGINSVLNFTKAFTHYAIKCLLAPESPNNDGSFAPITVKAPPASIVNARFPAPVGGRHLVGLYIPGIIFGALAPIAPKRVVADSSVLSAVTLSGLRESGKPYVFTFFSSGGMGGRNGKNGLDATAFPSNVANVPVEVMEHATPVLVTRRELIAGSSGGGRYPGGAGQRIGIRLLGGNTANVSCMVERTEAAPRGLLGGGPGRRAAVLVDGRPVDPKRAFVLKVGEELVLETPGGGGFGAPDTPLKDNTAKGEVI